MTLIAAHRGASLRLPDNSIAAFTAAIDAGCEAIETDVRADARGELVLSHDPVLPSERPVTLAELLGLAHGRIGLDLEIKEPELAAATAAVLAGWSGLVIITSFHAEALRAVPPSIATGLLVEPDGGGDPLARARDCAAGAVLVEDPLATDELLARASLPVWVWTVNTPERLTALIADDRVTGVITDDPACAVALRDHR